MVDKYDKFVSRHSKSSLWVTVPTGRAFYKGEMMKKTDWKPFKLISFEDKEFLIQSSPEAYCLKHYGNTYMELPPVHKRERHFCVKLDFNDETI